MESSFSDIFDRNSWSWDYWIALLEGLENTLTYGVTELIEEYSSSSSWSTIEFYVCLTGVAGVANLEVITLTCYGSCEFLILANVDLNLSALNFLYSLKFF
jgi:hypothetical protein